MSGGRWRRGLGRGALLIASLALSVVVGEGVFRWVLSRGEMEAPMDDVEWRARYRRMNETLYVRSEVPGLVYEPRPGSSVEMEYGQASFNLAGMRDTREFSEALTDKRRVIMIGDSLVWSEFMSLRDSLPRQVERALGPVSYEVLNLGVSGYETAQEALWYERAASRFRPHVVVVVFCMNDLMIMSGPYNRYANEEERRRKEEQDVMFDRVAPVRRETIDAVNRRDESSSSFKLFGRARTLWRRAALASSYVDEYTVTAADEERIATLEKALAGLARAIEADGARGVLVISPVLESWDRYHWEAMHHTLSRLGEGAGFTVLDPIERWRSDHDPRTLRFPGDNLHYNPRGNALLADVVAARSGLGNDFRWMTCTIGTPWGNATPTLEITASGALPSRTRPIGSSHSC